MSKVIDSSEPEKKEDFVSAIKRLVRNQLLFNVLLGSVLALFLLIGYSTGAAGFKIFLRSIYHSLFIEIVLMFVFYNALYISLYILYFVYRSKKGEVYPREKAAKIFRGILIGCVIHIIYKTYMWM